MGKNQEIETIDRSIKDAEIRLCTAKTHLDIAQKEMNTLENLETQLVDNIKYLKRNRVAVVASEFKKSKDALLHARTRLAFLKIERDNQKRVIKDVEGFLRRNRETMVKLLKGGENNVILGKFRKKDG